MRYFPLFALLALATPAAAAAAPCGGDFPAFLQAMEAEAAALGLPESAIRAVLDGAQRDPAYLLESLLNPSAQITTGYGLVAVTLKDGTEISGTLARETPSAVTVRLFDGQQRILPLAEIARRSAPVSVMPPMQGILQPREIRDVVGYLASLKGARAPRKRDAGNGE